MTTFHECAMESFEVLSCGDRLHARYFCAGDEAPVVLIATGGGPKGSLSASWEQFPRLLLARGISSIIFDFAGQGKSGGDRRVLTLAKGVQNLIDVLKEVLSWSWVRETRLGIMGSSFGGNVVLDYLASDSPLRLCAASFKSPCIDLHESYFQELGFDGMAAWKRDGFSPATGLNWEVIEDADASTLSDRLHRITIPVLITHGCEDESVPITQSRLIRDRVGGVADLLEMKHTNHHYSGGDDWDRMASVHVAWLAKVLAGAPAEGQ